MPEYSTQRTKKFSQLVPHRETYNGAVVTDSSYFYSYGVTRLGSYQPLWRRVIQASKNASSPMRLWVDGQYDISPLYLGAKSVGIADSWVGTYAFFAHARPTPALDIAKADRAAHAALFNAMRQGVQMLPILREAKKTLNMVANPFSALRKAVGNYSRRDHAFRGRLASSNYGRDRVRKEYVKAASDSWLEFNFGVKPLLMDIEAGCNELANVVNGPSRETFSHGFKVESDSGWQYVGVADRINRSNLVIEARTKTSYLRRYMGAFTPKMTGPATLGGARLGTTLPDFLPSVWEAMPYSWLVDYFVNVGDVLNGYAATSMAEINWMCCTSVQETTTETRILNDPGNNNVWTQSTGFSPMSCKRTDKHIERDADPSLSYPSLEFRSKLGPVQSLNLASLVTSREADRRFAKKHG